MYIDTHAHIVDNVENTINMAYNNNVKKIINCSEDIKTSRNAINLYKKHKNIFPAIGIHPLNANSVKKEDLKKLEQLIKTNYVVAMGEIGLDYYYNKENVIIQKEIFEAQLKLAQKYDLPIIIHSRNAVDDTINILKKYKLKGIVHCFSNSLEIANIYIKLGYVLGIGGVVTFKNTNLPQTLKNISINKIVLETDSPFLSPEPYRGKKNSPKNISIIAKKISEIYNLSIKDVEKITTITASNIFDI